MPFDGIDFSRQEFMLGKLERVTRLLGTEEKWCKHEILSWDGRRCIVGALILTRTTRLLGSTILASARDVTGISFTRIDNFNDDPETDHALVRRVLVRSRERIQTGQIPASPPRAFFLTKMWKSLF